MARRKHPSGKVQARPSQVIWEYEPTSRQRAFHESPVKFKLYGGSMGGGKSVALCMESIDLLLEFQGNRGYLCRHQLVDLKRSTLETFVRFCPRGLVRKHWKEDRIYEFWNGSELLYGSLGSSEDLDRIKSTEFGFFAIDEASETYEEYFLLLASRLRWTLPSGGRPRYHGIMASNPEPGWLKDRFLDSPKPQHAFFPALPKDNPHLPSDYVSTLMAQFPEEWVKRYVEGSWDVFEGQVYKEFNRAAHVYRDLEPGPYWQHIRVIDHGYTNPTCCLWAAVDQDGDIWIYDEHYESGLTIPENADVIKAKRPDFNGVTLIDPSCFAVTQVSRRGRPCSVVDEYRENGIVCISPYAKDSKVEEAVGINLVKQRLKPSPKRLDDGTEVLVPRIHFHEDCRNLLREIVKYRWRQLRAGTKGDHNEPEAPVDKDNHACFPAGTMIETETGVIPIEEVRAGLTVKTHLGWGKTLTDCVQTGVRPLFRLRNLGREVCATEDHPFFVDYNRVKVWTPEEGLTQLKRRKVPLKDLRGTGFTLEAVPGPDSPVYNFATEHGSYVANGFVVSNCDTLRYLCVYKPLGSKAPALPEAVPGTVRWEVLKIKKQLHRAQMGFAGWD